VTEVRFPKYGMSTVEVDVSAIHIEVGQVIAVGDPLIDVETDKVETTLESELAGVVTSIAVELGRTYEVGDVVCVIDVE
jgi:2-oxoglutarate dehydrogenase E2 component (dihydrolipoamide succinyltransferase)